MTTLNNHKKWENDWQSIGKTSSKCVREKQILDPFSHDQLLTKMWTFKKSAYKNVCNKVVCAIFYV